MGLALHAPLARMAGPGWMGHSGMIITPEPGHRVRLASICISIEDLSFSTKHQHHWVEGYCEACLICVRKWPAGATMTERQRHEYGRITYAIEVRCFLYSGDDDGCSVCITFAPLAAHRTRP